MKLKRFGRYAFCALLVAALLLLYIGRLFQWQILMGDEFQQESMYDRTDVIELDAARGQILDCKDNVLVGNRTAYDIVYNALDMVYEERNATILKVLDLLEERGEKWRDRLPIVLDENGEYQFAENREDDVASLKENLNMAEYATAQQCIEELADTYGCKGFSKEDTRSVTSVRYSMTRDGFSRTNPYIIAQNVSSETVGVIKQRSQELRGIEPRVSVARYYSENGALAPHVIGHTGIIQEEQFKQAQETAPPMIPLKTFPATNGRTQSAAAALRRRLKANCAVSVGKRPFLQTTTERSKALRSPRSQRKETRCGSRWIPIFSGWRISRWKRISAAIPLRGTAPQARPWCWTWRPSACWPVLLTLPMI